MKRIPILYFLHFHLIVTAEPPTFVTVSDCLTVSCGGFDDFMVHVSQTLNCKLTNVFDIADVMSDAVISNGDYQTELVTRASVSSLSFLDDSFDREIKTDDDGVVVTYRTRLEVK